MHKKHEYIFLYTEEKKLDDERRKIVQGQSYVWDFVWIINVANYENYIEIISYEVLFLR